MQSLCPASLQQAEPESLGTEEEAQYPYMLGRCCGQIHLHATSAEVCTAQFIPAGTEGYGAPFEQPKGGRKDFTKCYFSVLVASSITHSADGCAQ